MFPSSQMTHTRLPAKAFGVTSTKPVQRTVVVCQARNDSVWQKGAAAALSAALLLAPPAFADLNKYEQELGGEFGNGTAQQYGEADIKGRDFSGQDLRRSNFTRYDSFNH